MTVFCYCNTMCNNLSQLCKYSNNNFVLSPNNMACSSVYNNYNNYNDCKPVFLLAKELKGTHTKAVLIATPKQNS